MRIPCEQDLLSRDCETWAAAVNRCQGGNPYCGADGKCHADGACFAVQELTHEQAMIEIDRLKQELVKLDHVNRNITNSTQNIIEQLNLALEQAKTKGHAQRAFALRYCVGELERVIKL